MTSAGKFVDALEEKIRRRYLNSQILNSSFQSLRRSRWFTLHFIRGDLF